MDTFCPYIVVPVLLDQPTWGGEFIASFKSLTKKFPRLADMKIGQSYELYEGTDVVLNATLSSAAPVALADPKNPMEKSALSEEGSRVSLQSIIDRDPAAVLGETALSKHGAKIGVLIKFTQAQSNSYQLHVRQQAGQWMPKPESWYFLEPGIVTLGVASPDAWGAYEARCKEIEAYGLSLSQEVHASKVTVSDAQQRFLNFIQTDHPRKYVNRFPVPKGTAIDLSAGGVHHSWEEDASVAPLGNIVYEVQKNVYDEVSTLRSFDQGKMKSDGSLRPLTTDTYFQQADRSEEANDYRRYLKAAPEIARTDTGRATQLFLADDYALRELSFSGICPSEWKEVGGTYQHLFVKDGAIEILWNGKTWVVEKGHAVFIPACCQSYTLRSVKEQSNATVLLTYVP